MISLVAKGKNHNEFLVKFLYVCEAKLNIIPENKT